MIVKVVERLMDVSTAPLGADMSTRGVAHESLLPLLRVRNGFFAFESALLVRPCGGGMGSVEWWNEELSWKRAYQELPPGLLCFAEDAFGFQFAVDGSGFYSFDPETAELEFIAKTVDDWVAAIFEDFEMLTGFPLAHEWQLAHGRLQPGYRLAPAVPFVLGGEYSVAALRSKPDIELADFRASVYTQIKDLPEGAQVNIRIE